MAALDLFLDEAMRSPFVWGARDCLLWPADWVRLAVGRDPAAAFRGRYRTQLGAARILTRHGGLVALATRSMTAAGLDETTEPRSGDVGLVQVMTAAGPQPAGAIRTGARWSVLCAAGIAAGPFPTLMAWRV